MFRKLTLILSILFITCFSFLNIKAETPFSAGTNADGGLSYALGVYNAADGEMIKKWKSLETLKIEYAMLGVQWSENNEDMIENAIKLGQLVQLDILAAASSATTTMAEQMIDMTDAYKLSVARVNKAVEIESQNVVVAAAVEEQKRAHVHYKAHYDAWVDKYSGSKVFVNRGAIPSQLSVGNPSVSCKNPICNTVYTVGDAHPADTTQNITLNNIVDLSSGHHKVTCIKDHVWYHSGSGKFITTTNYMGSIPAGPTGPYWSCPPNYPECPGKDYHVKLCGGACGEYKQYATSSYGWYGSKNFTKGYEPHWIACSETARRDIRNLFTSNCSGYYYSCVGVNTCTNATNHINDDTTSTPSTPTPTPSYHACGVHVTTVTGSHSAAACGISGHYACDGVEHVSLTCPQENGQACDYGSYYACSPHTHAYPPVDNTPNCSNCTDGCSSCPVTCAVGHVYDPSKANQVSEHKTRTCRFCSQTWQKCVTSTAPKCRDPKRKKQNRHCWAAED